jgi:hypothetical protein
MNKGLIPFFSLALILVGIMLGGCDETGSGGSASTDVLTGEPAILDSVLAIDVAEDRPNGITNTFFSDVSDQVYLWIFWSNVSGRHTVEVRWLSPEDDIDDPPFRTDQEVFTSDTGEQITWFFVERPSGGFAQGEWIVEIFLDGLFERSHVFVVE